MARPLFSRDDAKQRLREAVQAVESRSCAEIVVAVRPWSARYTGVDALFGAGVAYAVLLYTLFAPQVFGLLWIALLVPAAFVGGFFLSRAVTPLRLAMVGAATVESAVLQGARACFTELNVSATRERSGVLVYVSLVERRCVVLADVGVRASVPEEDWAAAKGRIEAAVNDHGVVQAGLEALVAEVKALGELLEEPMPRREDDENELEDVA